MAGKSVFGDWAIEAGALVHSKSGYRIEKSQLSEERDGEPGVSECALTMVELGWCAMEEFIPALQIALSSVPNSINWVKTSQRLREEAYEMIVDQEAQRRLNARILSMANLETDEAEVDLLLRVGWRPTTNL